MSTSVTVSDRTYTLAADEDPDHVKEAAQRVAREGGVIEFSSTGGGSVFIAAAAGTVVIVETRSDVVNHAFAAASSIEFDF